MSGNSHQRKALQKAIASVVSRMAGPSHIFPKPPPTTPDRIHRFFEHGSLQTLLGVVGSIVGVFLDGRYFILLGGWMTYALVRSRALEGLPLRVRVIVHSLLLGCACAALFVMGVALNHSRPHTYTPSDYKNALKEGQPLPIASQITNVYNSYKNVASATDPPRITFTEWMPKVQPTDGGIVWTSNISNIGGSIALDVIGTVKASSMPKSSQSEDQIFNEIMPHAFDGDAPKQDMAPGLGSSRVQPLLQILTPADSLDWHSGRTVYYLTAVESYKDNYGNKYVSEFCMFIDSRSMNGLYCNSHNKTIKLGKR